MADPNDQEIVRAPPIRIVAMTLGTAATLGALALLMTKIYFFPWLLHYLDAGQSRGEALHRFEIVMLGTAALPLVLALFMTRLGFRVLRQDRWPPANSLVWHDTLIRRGRAARVRGIFFITLAIFLAISAIGLAAIPYRFAG